MPLVMGGIWLEVEETTWWGWRCEFAMVDGTRKRDRSGRLAVNRARNIAKGFSSSLVDERGDTDTTNVETGIAEITYLSLSGPTSGCAVTST